MSKIIEIHSYEELFDLLETKYGRRPDSVGEAMALLQKFEQVNNVANIANIASGIVAEIKERLEHVAGCTECIKTVNIGELQDLLAAGVRAADSMAAFKRSLVKFYKLNKTEEN